MNQNRNVISFKEFIEKNVHVIPISDFIGNDVIYIKVKRITLETLLFSGKIPNQLMKFVTELFESAKRQTEEEVAKETLNNTSELMELYDLICDNCMIEPSYEQVKDHMTFEQKQDIFDFSQTGIMKLIPSFEE